MSLVPFDRITSHTAEKLMVLFVMALLLTNLPAQNPVSTLSPNATDPGEPRNRIDAYLAVIEPLFSGYIMQPSVSADWAFREWGSVGIQVPLVYANFPSTVTFEVGDIQLNTLLVFYRSKNIESFKSAALGCDFFLNTGDVETGTGFGQYVMAPFLTFSFYPENGIMIAPIIEEYISLEKDKSKNSIHDLSLRINSTLTLDEYWVTLTPELLIDLLGDVKNLWAMRSSLGMMINPQVGLSADLFYQLAGEKRYNYLGRMALKYLLK